ncbi:MAG: hypothetical protein AAGJ73_13290 [Pseudomonadota bacterium]
MRISYPIARSVEEALTDPLGFAASEIEAGALDRAGGEVRFTTDVAPARYDTREEVEAAFEKAIADLWGEPVLDLNNHWRCWISYFRPIKAFDQASSLTEAERAQIDQRLGAAPGPRRAREQKGLDFGLFESRDPDRPGWSLIDDE